MLENVSTYIDKLHQKFSELAKEDSTEITDLADWLEEMEDSYTMVEQKYDHENRTIAASSTATESDGVDFF